MTFNASLSPFTANTQSSTSLNTRGIKAEETHFFICCLESLSTYTKPFSLNCSCGSTIRASSIYVSFCSFSGPCFCVFSPACLFPTFLKSTAGQTPLPRCLDFSLVILKSLCSAIMCLCWLMNFVVVGFFVFFFT